MKLSSEACRDPRSGNGGGLHETPQSSDMTLWLSVLVRLAIEVLRIA
jgi:hypothetical protein